MTVTLQSVPKLRRGVRRHFDAARNTPVLMAPERVVVLDDIADAIIAQCDGKRSVAEIVSQLAAQYAAPAAEISNDVLILLEDLVETSLVAV